MLAKHLDHGSLATAPRPVSIQGPRRPSRRLPPARLTLRAFAESCLADLPEAYRMVLWLLEVEGMTVPDVARRLGLSEPIVAARLHRARTMAVRALCRRCLPVAVTR